MLQELFNEFQNLGSILCCNFYIVYHVYVVNIFAVYEIKSYICCFVSLSEVIVEYGTGHLVVHNVLNNLYQSINAY